jgi:L,D-transpeptidase ErfK/SrfK
MHAIFIRPPGAVLRGAPRRASSAALTLDLGILGVKHQLGPAAGQIADPQVNRRLRFPIASTALHIPTNLFRLRRAVAAAALLAASDATVAATFSLDDPEQDVVGAIQVAHTASGETLLDIARRHDLGFTEIVAANPGVDPWVPGDGRRVVLPTRFVLPGTRSGIVINLGQMRLFYFPRAQSGEPARVVTHPIGIGVEYDATPLGSSSVVRKAHLPTWHPPESIRKKRAAAGEILPDAVPPGPDNPLGEYALYLGFSTYLVHGTNRPWGIGMRVSGGCIRMYPEDIESLYAQVPVGTPVRIVDESYAVGRLRGVPYLQVFADNRENRAEGESHTPLVQALLARVPRGAIDWDKVMRAAAERRSLALPITPRSPGLESVIEGARSIK